MKKAKAVSAIAISFFITALIYLCHTPVSIAMSRMGTASITDVEGIPCFSIPENFETRNSLPLMEYSSMNYQVAKIMIVYRTLSGVLEQLTTMPFQKYFLSIAFLLGTVQMGQRNVHSSRFSY